MSTKKSTSTAGSKQQPSVTLLSGGNPQIAKGEGDAKVQEYIQAMPGWKQDIGKRLDALITQAIPDVKKAVKWNTPFYGVDGRTWCVAFHCLTKYVKVAFPQGADLEPIPPGKSKQKTVRYLDIHEDDPLDEQQLIAWFKRSAELPGERW